MNELIFKTSTKIKWLSSSFAIIMAAIGIVAFLLHEISWWSFLFYFPCYVFLYLIVFQKYTITNTSLQVKNGYGGSGTRCIPLASITKLSRKKRGFQIDCKYPDGKIGFYEVRYIDNWQQMLEEIEKRTSLSSIINN